MEEKRFQRNIEDFTCSNCDNEMKGDGFTNHCSKCLWSKHVDINPGDRASLCGGEMKPIRIEKESKGYQVIQKCQKCSVEKRNLLREEDDFETILKIVKDREEY